MARLIFASKNFDGRVYDLVVEKTTVGRGDQNTLVIRDPSLSATHCEILMNGGEIIVRDLGSLNGTCVAGLKLKNQQSQAKSGQTIRFGSVEARLELDPSSIPADAAELTAIHTLGKIRREQDQARHQPQPASAFAQFDPHEPPVPKAQTILLPKSAFTESTAPVSSPETERVAAAAKGRCWKRTTLISLLALAGLFLLVWLLWGRK